MSGDVYFVSDTHWGHKNIQKFCPNTRVQGAIDEHDDLLVYNWNSVVRNGDRIYHLGDFSFMSAGKTHALLKRLNGQIHLIYGNHDEILRDKKFADCFASRQDYKELRVDGQKIVLMHFPIASFNQSHRGAWHLHGHSHGGINLPGKVLDVGIDNRRNGDMSPWSYTEVAEYMRDREIYSWDHH